MCRVVTWPIKFDFFRAHEEEKGINFMLELINLVHLINKLEPSWHLTYRLWSF